MKDASGPLSIIERRTVLPGNKHGQWGEVGITCFVTLVPNSVDKPQLTVAMIKEAWAHTPFAKPGVGLQPVGGRTLVTLPAYFRIVWPGSGFRPGQVREVTLLGHRVRIKPTLVHNVYHFGDGTSSPATDSVGGVYPTGDIAHAYDRAGSYHTSISTTYGGQFSVDGGAWADIPGSLTLTGPSEVLRVVTAKNRLVTH